MDILENISNDIQSHYGNIEHFLNVELKEGFDKMNKETMDTILDLIKQAENIPTNIFDTIRNIDSNNKNIYNPFSD
jgi:hypothetical protein